MAGRARYQAIRDALTKRTTDRFAPDPDDAFQPTPLDYVLHWIESGKTLKALAADLSDSLGFDCDYAMLTRFLRQEHGEGVDASIDEARARASHCWAEESIDIIDRADRDSSSAVSKAAAQARSRQWLAGKYNAKFSDQKGVSVSVSIGSLHLDALRSATARVTGALAAVSDASQPTVARQAQHVVTASLSE